MEIFFYILFGIGGILGIILHEFGHKLFCDVVGVKVLQVKYFNNDPSPYAPDGFVVHEQPQNLFQHFMITIGPMFTVGAFILLLFFFSSIIDPPISFYLQAIAFASLFGLFPSTCDVRSMIHDVNKNVKQKPATALFYPILGILFVFSFYIIRLFAIIGIMVMLSMIGVVTFFDVV